METIDEKIVDLGDSFRGLWCSRVMGSPIHIIEPPTWTVTFLYQGDMIETWSCDNPHVALDAALILVGLKT